MKRWILCLLLMAIFLSACGEDEKPEETKTQSQVTATEKAEGAATPQGTQPMADQEENVMRPGESDFRGKKVIFIGDSLTYYGKCVLDKGQKELDLEKRTNDQGYFYQICKANEIEVSVTNYTFGGHKLSDFYSGSCAAGQGHDGTDHMQYLANSSYDYVVLQEGSDGKDLTDILAECQPFVDLFRAGNPNTKFVFLVHHQAHLEGHSYLSNLQALEDAGFIVVDWGALIADVIHGDVDVPGADYGYSKNTFLISKSVDDGFNGNLLTGYITAQMTYCAITGEKAEGQDYSFCGDQEINSNFDFDLFREKQYLFDTKTNFVEVFNSPADMLGLQQLMDQYLAEKTYLNY